MTSRNFTLAGQLKSLAGVLDEAAAVIRQLPESEHERLQIRHYLCDELEGSALMARDDAAAVASPLPASDAFAAWLNDRRGLPVSEVFHDVVHAHDKVHLENVRLNTLHEALKHATGSAGDDIGTQLAKIEFAKRWDEAAQRECDQAVTPEFLRWLQDEAHREGVGANVAWNAGVAWARQQQGAA